MNSAAFDQVFSVPFRHLWSTNFSGEQTASNVRPLGLARFVGDEPNVLLKYLISENEIAALEANPISDSLDAAQLNQLNLNRLRSQWPIVLFGPSGTGKTSLAMTIISDLADQFAEAKSPTLRSQPKTASKKPIFISALDFDRRFRSALETDSILDFRKRLIHSGGLVVDDLNRLADKTAAQIEFVLILDEMSRKNRPIVVTLDVSPPYCNGLSPQLISRLSGGLTLPVNPPGPLARLEIIRDLAQINNVQLTEDAAKLLVDRLNVTVPKLDHVFAQIKTSLRSHKEDAAKLIDAAKLTQIFKKSAGDLEKLSQLIIKQVATEFDVKVSELKSNSRKQSIVMARGVAIYLNRTLLCTSFLKIGSYFGGRDHSTIMHAFRKIENLIDVDNENVDSKSIKNSVAKLKQKLAEQFASQINFI